MTDEQKQRRAETARANGRKSKGPITQAGKYRSSMNAISTGEHTQLHQEDLPSFFHLLSTDNRAGYILCFQDHLRRYQPTCEFERGLVRRMSVEIFLFDRQTDLTALATQEDIDWAHDRYPEANLSEQFLAGSQRLCRQRDLLRMIDRNKRTHLSAYQNFVKLFVQSRNQLPAVSQPLPEGVAEIPAAPSESEIEPSAAAPIEPGKPLKNKDLSGSSAPQGEFEISSNATIRIPPNTAFQMENEDAARKPASRRSVTL